MYMVEDLGCTFCSGQALYIGRLGNLDWYRCQDCGVTFSVEVQEEKKDKMTGKK